MPTFLPPRGGISQSQAYAEAAAFARAGDPVLITSAITHPKIVDPKTGQPVAIYTVNDFQPLQATLEADAPLDGGQEVTFRPVPMAIQLPDESDDAPSAVVTETISNVTREIAPHLEAVLTSQEPIEQIFRTYLPSDTSEPHEKPPLRVTLTDAAATGEAITAKAGFGDITNRLFPRLMYRAEEYPCLAAQ